MGGAAWGQAGPEAAVEGAGDVEPAGDAGVDGAPTPEPSVDAAPGAEVETPEEVPVAPPAAPGGTTSVLVADLEPVDVGEALAAQITDLIAQAIADRPGFEVKTMADVETILGLQASQLLLGCAAASCVPEEFDANTAQFLVTGSVGLVGANVTVTLNLIETKDRAVRERVSVVIVNSERMRQQLRQAVFDLFAWQEAQRRVYQLPSDQERSFAVFDLAAVGFDAELTDELTQLISSELEQLPGARVVTRDDIQAMLQLESDKQLLGCSDDTSCLVEIGGALGVSYLVAGSVGQLGQTFIISLRLIDPGRGNVENRVTESYTGVQEQLVGAVRHAARQLVGRSVAAPGVLRLTSNEEEAELFVDGTRIGELPLPQLDALSVGRHAVRVAKEDFLEWSSDVYIDPGAETALSAQLEPIPREWYERWEIWTAIGGGFAAVVAGTVTAVVLTIQSNEAPRNHPLDIEIQLPSR